MPILTRALLNIGHAIDHLVLLVFATAVGVIATEFGVARWEDLMPATVGAFVMFGLCSLPAGRLGDLWGRRKMMLIFFAGIGVSCLLVALTQNVWQMALALTVLGVFAAIYHPVGIPMLVQGSSTPGLTIGFNGLCGNLGIAAAALVSGAMVQWFGWRTAFVVPGVLSLVCAALFWHFAPPEAVAPAKRAPKLLALDAATQRRVFVVMICTATFGGLVFNLTTNGFGELLKSRVESLAHQPALLGALLAAVYAIASLAQIVVGRLIDRHPIRAMMPYIIATQIPLFVLAAYAQGWALYALCVASMVFVFGAIPFTDAIIVRFIDDRMRSRVSGARLAISAGISGLAVWSLGPLVKAAGFTSLLLVLAGCSVVAALAAFQLPDDGVVRKVG